MINILIVDDQKIIREGLKMLLSFEDDINILGECENGREALDFLKENSNVDVILMDVRMPIVDGVEGTKIIRKYSKDVKILILTTFNEEEYIVKSIKNGANGYILKDAESDELVRGIKTVFSGNMLLEGSAAIKLMAGLREDREKEAIDLSGLTAREEEIAHLIGRGNSNKEICKELFLTEGTVKNYVTKILDKLNLKSRTELAAKLNE